MTAPQAWNLEEAYTNAGARELAPEQGRLAYSGGFASALLVAAVFAFASAAFVGTLMRDRR
jgi:hypothetical protein